MKKYHGVDWLRSIACIGIMLMHIAANNQYSIDGFLYQKIIPSFTDFVFLFMTISAFGMCCGYFKKTLQGQINWTTFYKKRYIKTLPFFAFLILIDLVLNFSLPSLYEGLFELTLLHGLIPNSFSVIGVGWFLGTVFVFYLIFPFFCVLIETKPRAWGSFFISLFINIICTTQFGLSRTSFITSSCYFLLGGIIYLYKEKLEKIKWYFIFPFVPLSIAIFYLIGTTLLTRLFVIAVLLLFTISFNGKKNKVISFISGISLEIYLSHMVIFRGIEKFHLNTRFGNGWGQFLITSTLVLIGTILFSVLFKAGTDLLRKLCNKK